MIWDLAEGNWKQFKGTVRARWGKLTEEHLDAIAGKRDQLVAKIQEIYGIKRLEARPTATLCIDCKTLEEIRERQEHG